MNKLGDLSKRMDRIKVLMDASGQNIEQMLATFASDYVGCDNCPLRAACDPDSDVKDHINDLLSCYSSWLKYLEANDDLRTM